jgi:TonB family protein
MSSMPAASKRLALSLLVSVAMAGCASNDRVIESPVVNEAPPLKPGVYSIKDVEVRPVATKQVEPDFPPELSSILSGKAVAMFTVGVDGKVTDASVVQADDILFGESAVTAVLKWRFRPAELKGAPVNCRMTMPFYFSSPWGSAQLEPSESPPSPETAQGSLRGGGDSGASNSGGMDLERH